jgi:transcriptional regulator GlxA family with amidase domain
VQLKRRHLITQSDRLYCVGSVNSIADFMVHLIGAVVRRSTSPAPSRPSFRPEARQAFATAAFLSRRRAAITMPSCARRRITWNSIPAKHIASGSLAAPGRATRSLTALRQATGQTPMQYLRDLRLREARALLQHSDLAIADIGWRCGFISASRFAQAFRSGTGLSPRDYRTPYAASALVPTAGSKAALHRARSALERPVPACG